MSLHISSCLGVARASTVAAYEQLLAEGYIETRLGSGTFVSADVARLAGQSRRRQTGIKRSFSPPTGLVKFEQAHDHDERLPFNTGRTLIDARTAEIDLVAMVLDGFNLTIADLQYAGADTDDLEALRPQQ